MRPSQLSSEFLRVFARRAEQSPSGQGPRGRSPEAVAGHGSAMEVAEQSASMEGAGQQEAVDSLLHREGLLGEMGPPRVDMAEHGQKEPKGHPHRSRTHGPAR